MAKKVKTKANKKKKKKVSRKEKKLAEILKPDAKEIQEDAKLTKKIGDDFTQDSEAVEVLPQPIVSSAPVLERVANAEDRINLEQELAAIRLPDRKREEETGINYSTTTSSYLPSNTAEERGRNMPQHNETPGDYSTMFQDDDEHEETRRIMGQGDLPKISGERNNEFEMERPTFVKADKDARKTRSYISEGDYK